MGHPLFLGSEFGQVPAGGALFHVIPVPYEATVSYGEGTASGPGAILRAADQLEVYDGLSCPGEEGIHTVPAVDTIGDPEEVFRRITEAVYRAVTTAPQAAGIPVVLGGEHSITAPAISGVLEARDASLGRVGVVQIDAHADLRDSYEGQTTSHACVARRIHQDLELPIVQIGTRALSPEEVLYRSSYARDAVRPIVSFDAVEIVPDGVRSIELPPTFPTDVYLTVDIDGLDPSICPATGTPVPGGLGWYQTLAIITAIAGRRRIVGFDVVELAPIPGTHAWEYSAAELVHRVMGIISRARA
jgi:agmatinase